MSMPHRESQSSAASPAEALLARCLLQPAAKRASIMEELASAHPEHADELRQLWTQFQELQETGLFGGRVGERLGEFRILSRIGEGAMGVVFLAEQEPLGRNVALKVIRPELTLREASRERFRREARAVAALRHDAIVPVHAYGEQDGFAYLALEWVDGLSLGDVLLRLQHRKPEELDGAALAKAIGVDPTEAAPPLFRGSWVECCAGIAHRIAGALQQAHENGVVHRDVKPSNIMIARDGRVLLLDFGLAHTGDDARLTRTGNQPGSLAYMSPEQVAPGDRDTDVVSDVYSLGATLYECLTLRLPFDGKTPAEVVRKIVENDAPRVRLRNRKVPVDLGAIVATALAKARSQRYATAAAMAADAGRFLDGEPVVARAPGTLRRVWHGVRRRPARVAWAVAAVLVVVLGARQLGVWRETREMTRRAALERALEDGFEALGTPDNAKAEPRFRDALVLEPGSAYAVGGLVLAQLWQCGPDTACRTLDDFASVESRVPQLGWVRAALLRERGDAAEAQRIEQRLAPRDEESSFLRAMCLRRALYLEHSDVVARAIRLLEHTRAEVAQPRALYDLQLAKAVVHSRDPVLRAHFQELPRTLESRWGDLPRALKLAEQLMTSSELEQRLRLARLAARLDPTALGALARLLWRAGQDAEADRIVQDRLRAAPRDWRMLRTLATRRTSQGHHEEAVGLARRILAARPNCFVAQGFLGQTLRRAGRPKEALGYLQRSVQGGDRAFAQAELGATYLALSEHEAAEKHLRRAVELTPERVSPWRTLGRVRRERRDIDGAIVAYEGAVARDDAVRSHYDLASCYFAQGRREDAARHCEIVLQRRPKHARARRLLGDSLLLLARAREAEKHYAELLKGRPTDPVLLLRSAQVAADNGKPDEALRLIDRLLRVVPIERLSAATAYGVARTLRKSGKVEEGLALALSTVARRPRDAALWAEIAYARKALGDRPGSVEAARRALEIDPGFSARHQTMYDVLGSGFEGLFELAMSAFLAKNRVGACETLAGGLMRAGRLTDARVVLEAAIERGRTSAKIWFQLGCVHERQRATADAIAAFEKAIALAPKHSQARAHLANLQGRSGKPTKNR